MAIILKTGLQPSCDSIFFFFVTSSSVVYFLILENTRRVVLVQLGLHYLHEFSSSYAHTYIYIYACVYVHLKSALSLFPFEALESIRPESSQ